MEKTYNFRCLIKDLQNGEKITELQRKHGFELFETIVRLVKYKQGYKFYKYNFKFNTISPIEFLDETVKDNTPVYDMLLSCDEYYTFFQIKNQRNININHELSIENLVQKLIEKGVKTNYKIILNDEYESYKELYKNINWSDTLIGQQKIQLKDYQQKYYTEMCQMIEKYDKSCLFLPPRFGKTYLIGKYIQEHQDKECCIFTSYPTECFATYEQLQAEYGFNFIYQSRQYFQEANYKEKLEEYKDVDVIFLDEYHYGGKTDLSQRVLNYLSQISAKKIKFVYVSGTAQSLIQIFSLPYISLDREIFEQINYPIMNIYLCESQQIQNQKRLTQKKIILQELNKRNIDKSMQDTFVYLETDGNSKEQQEVIGLSNVFCESHKVGGTYPQLRNIFVMNQNLGELLIQQIFRCMTSVDVDTIRNIYIYNVQQIIEIVQYFQRLFKSQQSLKDYKYILPNCVKIIDADAEIIEYINNQNFKLSCVTGINEKYIISKIYEKFDTVLLAHVQKENTEQVRKQQAIQQLDKDLHSVTKDEKKLNPYISLIDRVSSYITLCCYVKNKQNCYDEYIQDYSLYLLLKLLDDNEYNRLQQIVNGMYKIHIVAEDFDYKIRWICKVFDSQNTSQLIYNYYNKLQLYIATENKINVYEKFMQQICVSTMYERKHNAEILTPIAVCQEMISKGAEYIECLQKKLEELPAIIEPCCGKGAFCVCMYEKLRELGYTEKQILEEILYINDINTFNTFIVQLILNPANQYKMNMWNEEAVNGIDYSDFDLVITNPPYNQGKKSIYQDFVQEFQSAKHQIVLIPSKCLVQTQNKLQNIFEKSYISKEFNGHLFCKDVEIVTMYMITNVNKDQVNYKINQLNQEIQIFKSNIDLNNFEIKENSLSQNNITKCYTSSYYSKKGFVYLDKSQIQIDYNFWKLCIIHKVRNTFNWIIVSPDEVCNNSFIGIKCQTKERAQELQKILMSDKYQVLIKQLSYSQRDITENILRILFYKL